MTMMIVAADPVGPARRDSRLPGCLLLAPCSWLLAPGSWLLASASGVKNGGVKGIAFPYWHDT